jgi:DNA (cytosine-5)-methyltransferase 1
VASKALTFGSLFAGIGGIDLGLERAGLRCRWQSEWDDFCGTILKKHWPDMPLYGDITKIDPADLEPVDLICGGFPCQPVSHAGKRLVQEDERWLWPEFERILAGVKPPYVLIENVEGLLRAGIDDVLGGLARLGYDAEWDCIPAAAVGAPHLRYRVWIVAYPRGTAEQDGGPVRQIIFNDGRGLQDFAHYWTEEPADVPRVAQGVPKRVDRLKALGNAVVPQVVEWIGRRIVSNFEGTDPLPLVPDPEAVLTDAHEQLTLL